MKRLRGRRRNAAGPSDRALRPEHRTDLRFGYDEFLQREGIPVHEGFGTGDVRDLARAPWKRLGGSGAYLRLHGHQGLAGAFVNALAPGERTVPERHVYEEVLYVIDGRGEVVLWQDGATERARVPVERGALLAPPLNALHRLENTGDGPLLLLGVTNAPPVFDLYRSDAFVFESPHRFADRWDGAADGFTPGPDPSDGAPLPYGNANDPFLTNFVPDVRALGPVMHRWNKKHADFATFRMAGNALCPHVSRWDAETYQTAHRHNAGATVMLLEGSGFFMMWPREAGPQPFRAGNGDAVVREPFVPGGVYSPPHGWYHLHFNTSDRPALYLAVTTQGRRDRLGFVHAPAHHPAVEARERDGAHPLLIRREDEDPEIGRLFRRAVAERRAR